MLISIYTCIVKEPIVLCILNGQERINNIIEHHEERIALLTVMGIKITEENKADYIASLRNCMSQALTNGYVDEYKMIKQKLDLFENRRRDER